MTILVTGGAGFIGTNFIREWLESSSEPVVCLDCLTYAGHRENLEALEGAATYIFIEGDIADEDLVGFLLASSEVRAVLHFAAETHVDRSIRETADFVRTNVLGTTRLLETCRNYHDSLSAEKQAAFRFVQISTDEVYGSLGEADTPFTEDSRHAPNSPYAASKAAADHMVRAYHQTYGLPVLTVNASNNYGPFQFPEKLIPLVIYNALKDKPLPLYGDGQQRRDWLHVSDFCSALRTILEKGMVGGTYNAGSGTEKTNTAVVQAVCDVLDTLSPRKDGKSYAAQMAFVADRPGHDRRYALDASKLMKLGWEPHERFEPAIEKTVRWYLENPGWMEFVADWPFREWLKTQYGGEKTAG